MIRFIKTENVQVAEDRWDNLFFTRDFDIPELEEWLRTDRYKRTLPDEIIEHNPNGFFHGIEIKL
jgi:hypothetical protein